MRWLWQSPLFFTLCILAVPIGGALAETNPSSQSVVFFWNGDEVSTLYPTRNIADVVGRYQERGSRVVQAIGLPPTFFKQFVQMDRRAHPADYEGKQVTLIIHGHGARNFVPVLDVKKGAAPVLGSYGSLHPEPKEEAAPSVDLAEPMDRVKDEEIILAFIEGIGPDAKAEAISSHCFFGQECLAVSLNDTPLATRVSRLIVPKRTTAGSLASLIPAPTSQEILSRVTDILLKTLDLEGD